MAGPTLEAVVSTVDSLLIGATSADHMPVAVERMRSLFQGSKACFARFDADLALDDVVATNPDAALGERAVGDLAEDFAQWAEGVRGVPIGQVYRNEDLFGAQALRRSRVWREWMAPQDMYGGIACRLPSHGSSVWMFDVQRGRRQAPFEASDMALLASLAPVLRRVAETRLHLDRLTVQRDDARAALDRLAIGMILVDGALRLVHANAAAEDLLRPAEGALGLRQGHVVARKPADHQRLKQTVAATLAARADPLRQPRGSLVVRNPGDGAASLSLCVMPALASSPSAGGTPTLLIALRPLTPTGEVMAEVQQLFGLTETEARFASMLASGSPLAEVAAHHGVRMTTARTHLARIFQKTGTRQQSQLVSLLWNATLPLRPH